MYRKTFRTSRVIFIAVIMGFRFYFFSSILAEKKNTKTTFFLRKKTKSKNFFFGLTFFPGEINTFWDLIIAIQAIPDPMSYTCIFSPCLTSHLPHLPHWGGPKRAIFIFDVTFVPGEINALWDLIIAIQAIPNRMSYTCIFRFPKKKLSPKNFFPS